MTHPDNFTDPEKLREIFKKHSINPWDFYHCDGWESFENQDIKNYLMRGIWKLSEWITVVFH